MSIGLTDRIGPRNNGFIGMVSANQIIGTNVGGIVSFLPSSTISSNSISESYLKIYNSPTNNYYLKWSSTDGLTWDSVAGGTDVAWSGAYQYYALSSLSKDRYTEYSNFSSQTRIKYAPSRSVNNGWFTVLGGSGAITHGLISTPRDWSLKPSGNINFGITSRVDATKIYVNLTTKNNESVYWYAST
jgi:hypothetical protein